MNTDKWTFKTDALRPEITPEQVYRRRRQFFKTAALAGAGALLAGCAPQVLETGSPQSLQASVEPLVDTPTSFEDITNYVNYYEYTTDKRGVADMAANLRTSPWQVEVYGLAAQPKSYSVEELLQRFPQEERVYRMRCVEGWSMVIPWLGFSLGQLLEEVQPLETAKYVRFETLMDPEQMAGQYARMYPWPYQEGLRLDEAMHPLTILASGLYGKPLPNQNGAPLRLVVPWKYGFKSIKAIVKIELVAQQPETLWSTIAPDEYGFYSNVNPQVDHPRWSQASERRISESGRRPTLMFNGYEAEVAALYTGMDLRENY